MKTAVVEAASFVAAPASSASLDDMQRTNGLYHSGDHAGRWADQSAHDSNDNAEAIEIEPEPRGAHMSTPRREDYVTSIGKTIMAAVLSAAICSAVVGYAANARAEEKIDNLQRQLTSVQDDVKTEREARELALRKITALETQLKVTDELERLNRQLEGITGRRLR